MFSTLPTLPHNLYQASYYAPRVSSPLTSSPIPKSPSSPRDGNTSKSARQPKIQMSPSPTLKRRKDSPYSKRITKENPLIHNRGDGRETRRTLFLRKVREESEERRWNARGGEDEMMRMIWLAEQKRRSEKQAWDASSVPGSQEEEDFEWNHYKDLTLSSAQNQDEEMVDEVAQQEDAEIEALLSLLEHDSKNEPPASLERRQTPYGSDDEEYDNVFLDVINESEYEHLRSSQSKNDGSNSRKDKAKYIGNGDHDMMDMT